MAAVTAVVRVEEAMEVEETAAVKVVAVMVEGETAVG